MARGKKARRPVQEEQSNPDPSIYWRNGRAWQVAMKPGKRRLLE